MPPANKGHHLNTASRLFIFFPNTAKSFPRIEYFFIASDKKDIPEGIPLSRCITYDKDTLFIQYDRDFDTWDSTKKVQFYSSMNTTKVILKLVC